MAWPLCPCECNELKLVFLMEFSILVTSSLLFILVFLVFLSFIAS